MPTARVLLQRKGSAVYSVSPRDSIMDALRLMKDKNVGALLVLEGSEIRGIVSERDFARKVCLTPQADLSTPVEEYMTRDVVTIAPDDTLETCMQRMTDMRIRHLPVVDGGRLVGLISIGDVVKEVISDREFLIQNLESYILGGKR